MVTIETAGIAGTAALPGEPGKPARARSTASRPPRAHAGLARRATVASLVALPLLVYGLPALLGHPVAPGDDLTQNLPLRELVGHDLRSGHLPVFDPYIWGGAPLLAGWNAGAAYPLTWLFAVLPGAAGWTVNLVAAAATAGLGCFAFLRASRLGLLGSWAGATTYAFGGAMAAQVPHIGLIIGMSWVPVALLAVLRLTDGAATGRSLMRWTAILAGAVALVILSGEPRAVTDGAAVLLLYAAWRLVRLGRPGRPGRPVRLVQEARWKAPAAVCSGALAGVGLGAVQVVPGLAAVAVSQRAHVTAQLFGAGSLPARWLALLGVPDLLGGSGSFGQPVFLAHYNLTEVSGYVGLLPLVAAAALLARLRRSRPVPEWAVWEVIAAAGILLTLGNHTPLWHVLIHIPLVSGQRLQSRNILVADLALAVLLAHWLDSWARNPGRGAADAEPASPGPADGAERVLGALPALGVIALVAVALTAGPSFLEWMGVGAGAGADARSLGPWLVPSLLLALGALALVAWGPRLLPTLRGALAGTFVVVDLLVFAVTTVVAVGAPPSGTGTAAAAGAPSAAVRVASAVRTPPVRPIAALHLPGRFAVYDPGLLDPSQLTTLGVPDANAVDGTWSVQGYGSIVGGHYAAATGVHDVSGRGQDVFSPSAAVDGAFDSLSTSAVLTPSQYLVTPARRATGTVSAPGTRRLSAAAASTWFLGAPLPVRSARVEIRVAPGAAAAAASRLRVGALSPGGAVDWATSLHHHIVGASGVAGTRTLLSAWDAAWRSPVVAVGLAVGLAVDPHARVTASPPVIESTDGRPLALDGELQNALVAPHWRYGEQDGAFTVFVDQRARAPLSLRAVPGRSLRGAAVDRLSGPSLEPLSALVTSPHGVEVVRAVAAAPGWTASWAPSGGDRGAAGATTLGVRRLGVVQVVRVPGGRGVLTWRYVAPGLLAGEAISLVALVLVVALVLAAAVTGRRRRPRRPQAS